MGLIVVRRKTMVQDLSRGPSNCPKCKGETRILRLYDVTSILFPLFSTNNRFDGRCVDCKSSVPVDLIPNPLPPKPFMHRMGFVVALGIGFAGWAFDRHPTAQQSAMAETAPSSDQTTQPKSDYRRLRLLEDEATASGFGATKEEQHFASTVAQILSASGGDATHVRAAAKVVPTSPRRVVIVGTGDEVTNWPATTRREVLQKIRTALKAIAKVDDEISVGLKTSWSYGAIGSGPANGEWQFAAAFPQDAPLIRALDPDVVSAPQ